MSLLQEPCTGPLDSTPSKLHLPRILCLHGGGTNSRIFRAQCRTFRRELATSFRLVFADAPFSSAAGPDVTPVYGGWGPFRAWLARPGMQDKLDLDKLDGCLAAAIDADDAGGATGPWVGLLGFSQGAVVAATLLMRQQQRWRRDDHACHQPQGYSHAAGHANVDYRFAVLLAGRGPLLLPGGDLPPPGSVAPDADGQQQLLQFPTIHVHGLRDPGIHMHRALLRCCHGRSARLVEWDGDHRVPLATRDVRAVVAQIQELALGGMEKWPKIT